MGPGASSIEVVLLTCFARLQRMGARASKSRFLGDWEQSSELVLAGVWDDSGGLDIVGFSVGSLICDAGGCQIIEDAYGLWVGSLGDSLREYVPCQTL